MKKLFLTLAIAIIAATASFAQETYKWDRYSLSFTVPENMEIAQNTDEIFQVKDDNLTIAIYPFEYEKAKSKEIAKALVAAADKMGLDLGGETVTQTVSGKNIETVYMVAASKENENVFGIVAISLSTLEKVSVATYIYTTEDRAEEAGAVLGSLAFGD